MREFANLFQAMLDACPPRRRRSAPQAHIAQAGAPVPANATLKEIIAAGQKLESKMLVKAVRLYLTRRLDVYWGVVKQV